MMNLLYNTTIISAILTIASCNAFADTKEIKFDDGNTNITTVIGLYADNGRMYHQAQDISIYDVDMIHEPAILLHAHVGSEIKSANNMNELKCGIRVNRHKWHWIDLNYYKDDLHHWLEFPIPKSEMKNGLNRIETTSTIASNGNMTSKSLDILGSNSSKIYERSYHTFDLKTYRPMKDRNWGIRLKYKKSDIQKYTSGKFALKSNKKTINIEQSMQLTISNEDDGNILDPILVNWNADNGWIDEYGLYHPVINGRDVITAEYQYQKYTIELDIKSEIPYKVEKPNSDKRLKDNIPDNHIDLSGYWNFIPDPNDIGIEKEWYKDNKSKWGQIYVPGSWQAQGFGLDYHGIGWYKRQIDIPAEWRNKHVRLHFNGVSTIAMIWINGKYAGEHTGNWSPFVIDSTKFLNIGSSNSITVRVKEDQNHFSTGFPLVVGMHYGGIWQSITMSVSGNVIIDDVFAKTNYNNSTIDITVDTYGDNGDRIIYYEISDPENYICAKGNIEKCNNGIFKSTIPIENPIPWSPESPKLYKIRITAISDNEVSDVYQMNIGMRDVEIKGTKLLLNGKPIYIRGILHWGYYPHLISIVPSEKQIRKEFTELQKAGFNLVKVCMFTFPKRFYEIADEMGMLVWQEYPLWYTFPKSTDIGPFNDIVNEYTEWFKYDRNFTCVILRDLTCEATDMNQQLTNELFDLGKQMTGDAVLEDNSSYLITPRSDFHDGHFYFELDDHYRNIEGWAIPAIRAHDPLKPFIGGEDFDIDTYLDIDRIKQKFFENTKIPWWYNNDAFSRQERLEKNYINRDDTNTSKRLISSQKKHSFFTRKALIEEYRRFPETAGFVMTHIIDNPITRPGFFDDFGKPKWDSNEWRNFNNENVILLHSNRKSFCFNSDEIANFELLFSNYGNSHIKDKLFWQICDKNGIISEGQKSIDSTIGSVVSAAKINIPCSDFKITNKPKIFKFYAWIDKYKNEWTLYIFPQNKHLSYPSNIHIYKSNLLLPSMPESINQIDFTDNSFFRLQDNQKITVFPEKSLIITDEFDNHIFDALVSGVNVLYTGGDDHLPMKDTLFWRETSINLPLKIDALGDFPHEGYIDRQFLDLTQRHVFDTSSFRNGIYPIIWGINARFNSDKFTDYIFEAKVGKGKLLACCFNMRGETNIAGKYLMNQLIKYAMSNKFDPQNNSDKLYRLLLDLSKNK